MIKKYFISLVLPKIVKLNLSMPDDKLYVVKDYDNVDKKKVDAEALKKAIEEKNKQAAEQTPIQK